MGKDQHFVPQFYLRHFAADANAKQIGIFKIDGTLFLDKGGIKGQAQKPNFYGADGELESLLAEIEGGLAQFSRDIIRLETLPGSGSKAHQFLIFFVSSMERRTVSTIDGVKKSFENFKDIVDGIAGEKKTEINFDLSHEEAVKMSIRGIKMGLLYMPDLRYKLIKNVSETPFITSDHPVAFYNQYLESKGSSRGMVGYGSLGLQILFPLSPRYIILFYDQHIYKVGTKREKVVQVHEEKEIDQLNLLQMLNCDNCVYFNHEINEQYLRKLLHRSHSFNRANEIITRQFPSKKDVPEAKSRYIYTRKTGLATALNLSFVKVLSAAKARQIDKGRIHFRPVAEYIMDLERRKRKK